MKKNYLLLVAVTLSVCFYNNAFGTVYYLRTTGSPTLAANWTQDPTGLTSVSPPANFSGTTHTWYYQRTKPQ